MNAVCPPLARLQQLLSGTLTPPEESVIEDHVEHCQDCQRSLVGLTADADLMAQLAAANAVNPEIPDSLRRRAANACPADAATLGQGEATGGRFRPLIGNPPDVPGHNIQEVLGQGGLAVVYRAVHRQLRRTVALKVLRNQPSADERERLRREAGALAGLRHPNIVQIFEAGEVDGRPYLVLEFVAGGSLSRFAAGRPMPPRDAAILVASVASAAHAAHRNGLIHRDLKPANILLEWDGGEPIDDLRRCRPKLTDFGLVKDVTGDSDLTHKRDLIGTPSYMAPEQAAGNQDVDQAVDIWALGAVLYEMLTGRPPFQGPSALDTLVQVRFSEPVAPSQLQPRMPRDLETICLKCLQKIPTERYATAQQVADDLNRWLSGSPIAARRTLAWSRGWRWCRRNPPAAILGATAAFLLFTLSIAGPVVALRESSLRKQAADRAAQAAHNLDLASQALDETLLQVYQSIGIRPDVIHDFDRNVSQPTVPYLEELVTQTAITPEQQLRQARAKRQLARSLPRQNAERAREHFEQANAGLLALITEDPDRREFQWELSLNWYEFGRFLMESKSFAEAETKLRRAITLQESFVASESSDFHYREGLANTLSCLGERCARDPARAAEARPLLTRALELRSQLRKQFATNPSYAMNEAFSRIWLGRALITVNDPSAAIAIASEGADVIKAAIALKPDDGQLKYLLANLEQHWATSLSLANRWDEAVLHWEIATELNDRLASTFVSAPEMNRSATQCHNMYGIFLAKQKNWQAAARQTSAAVAIVERFLREVPDNRPAKIEAVANRFRLAEMLIRCRKITEGSEVLRGGRETAQALNGLFIEDELRLMLADSYLGLAEAMVSTNAAEALELCDRAIAILERPELSPSPIKGYSSMTERAQANRRKAQAALGRTEESEAEHELFGFPPENE